METYLPLLPLAQAPFGIAPETSIITATICDFWNDMAAKIMDIVSTQEHEPRSTVQDPETLKKTRSVLQSESAVNLFNI